MRMTQWGIRNPVPINLINILIIALGLIALLKLNRELFPAFSFDIIQVTVDTEGSSSAEQVDRTINRVIQPRLQNIDGVKDVYTVATNTQANLYIELQRGTQAFEAKQDIQDQIDGLRTLPQQALQPRVAIIKQFDQAIQIAVTGDNASAMDLRRIAEWICADLKAQHIASRADLAHPHPLEIAISVPLQTLRAKSLSLQNIAAQISKNNTELSAGAIRGDEKTILIKGDGRKTSTEALRNIPIRLANGEFTFLGDLVGSTNLSDGFVEDKSIVEFNGKKAAVITIERADGEDIIDLCKKVYKYTQEVTLPSGFRAQPFNDLSVLVKERLELILKNGIQGLVLVLLVLTLFLEWRTAFWVAGGIAFALIGTLAILFATGNSINMLTLFAFLITTGIIVDDAIVIGEAFYEKKLQGLSAKEAAIQAIQEMSFPVLAMMSTTIVAFVPLLFVAGIMGKFIFVLPVVIISALALSLFESLFILPTHLAHHCGSKKTSLMRLFEFLLWPIITVTTKAQPHVNKILDLFSTKVLAPAVRIFVYHRYAVTVGFLALLIFVVGLIPAGVVKTAFFPHADAEYQQVVLEFDQGSSVKATEGGMRTILEAFAETKKFFHAKDRVDPVGDYLLEIGREASHKATLSVRLIPSSAGRKVSGQEFIDNWRERIPPIINARSVEFNSVSGGPPAKPIEIWFSSEDEQALGEATKAAASFLSSMEGVVDVGSDDRPGPHTVLVKLKDEYRGTSVSEAEILTTVASAYHGIKVDTFYRDENEIKIFVRAALQDRQDYYQLSNLQLDNGMTIGQVANLSIAREPAELNRINGSRTITVYADINRSSGANAVEVRQGFVEGFLAKLPQHYPQVRWQPSGESQSGAEALNSMLLGYIPALCAIYIILATIFRSYIQPLVIMVTIPFSFVGAIIGHWIMDQQLNLMSAFGIIALTGVAVNDSLVLIDATNGLVRQGISVTEALAQAARRRLRPILLTSLTTVAGLAGILFETSYQAQFLIPLVTSLVFGIMVSTVLLFILVPVTYAILLDLLAIGGKPQEELITSD